MVEPRKPLLIDELMNTVLRIGPETLLPSDKVGERGTLVNALRASRRFVFDADATRRVGEVIRDIPEHIVRNSEFAVAPFDHMWIEFPFPILHETIAGKEPSEEAAERSAFLITQGLAIHVWGGRRMHEMLPIAYLLNEPTPPDKEQEIAERLGISRIGLDGFFWGSTWSRLDATERREIRSRHSVLLPAYASGRWSDSALAAYASESTGAFRNLITMLLMLNRPSITTFSDVPSTRGFIRNKVRPFFSHTTVSIRLDPKPILLRMGTRDEPGTPKRRHEVRGHFCHDAAAKAGSARECVHEWVRTSDADSTMDRDGAPEDRRWRCAGCGGKRWWRTSHLRGHGGEGFVIKDMYNITHKGD